MIYVVIEYGCIECAGHPRDNSASVLGIYDSQAAAVDAAKQAMSNEGYELNDRVLEKREEDGALVAGTGQWAVEVHEVGE